MCSADLFSAIEEIQYVTDKPYSDEEINKMKVGVTQIVKQFISSHDMDSEEFTNSTLENHIKENYTWLMSPREVCVQVLAEAKILIKHESKVEA